MSLVLTWQCWKSSPLCGTWGLAGPWRGRSSVSLCSSYTPQPASQTWGETKFVHNHKWSYLMFRSYRLAWCSRHQLWSLHRQSLLYAKQLSLLEPTHVFSCFFFTFWITNLGAWSVKIKCYVSRKLKLFFKAHVKEKEAILTGTPKKKWNAWYTTGKLYVKIWKCAKYAACHETYTVCIIVTRRYRKII